jgi:hypothetical protein
VGRITSVGRGDQVISVPPVIGDDLANLAPAEFAIQANARIFNELHNIATQLFDNSRPVYEYRFVPGGLLTGPNVVEVLPEFEMPEIIEALIIAAPPYATLTIQLGERIIPMTMNASGVQLVSPQAIRLDRHDRRILTLTGGSQPINGTSNVTTNSVADPGALAVITSQALTGGLYNVGWTVQPGATASHANNFGLYVGATQIATSLNGTTAGGTFPQPNLVVNIPAAGATLAVESILSEATTTYTAQLVTQQISQVITGGTLFFGLMGHADTGGAF